MNAHEPTSVDPPASRTDQPSSSRSLFARYRIIIVVLVLLAAALVAAGLARSLSGVGAQDSGTAISRAVTEYPPGSRAEPVDLSGAGLTGESIEIGTWRGAVVVINVWGSWCAPCRQEAPVLAAASSAYADEGVQFLGVNVRDNAAAAIAFEESYGITYPSIDDSDGRALLSLAQHLPGSGVPVTLILDRDGRPAARILGAVEESTLTSLLDTILAEQAPDRT